MTSFDSRWIAIGGTLIEVLAAIVIAFHALWALASMLQHFEADRPRLIIAEGVLTALGFSVAGTLLKALALETWQQIGMFAFVLGLRTLLKRVFAHERKLILNRRASSAGV